jgi:hypothetical protein
VLCFWRDSPQWARASSFKSFLDHTQRRTTVGSTPLDEWSARRRDLYRTTHTKLTTNKHPCTRLDSNQQSKQACGRRPLRPCGHWDRKCRCLLALLKKTLTFVSFGSQRSVTSNKQIHCTLVQCWWNWRHNSRMISGRYRQCQAYCCIVCPVTYPKGKNRSDS